jgi:hypothetical protein
LREGLEELQRTVRELEDDPDYEDVEFLIAMQHLYHHLNTAWNSRNESPERAWESAEEDFYNWRRFPTDIPMD